MAEESHLGASAPRGGIASDQNEVHGWIPSQPPPYEALDPAASARLTLAANGLPAGAVLHSPVTIRGSGRNFRPAPVFKEIPHA